MQQDKDCHIIHETRLFLTPGTGSSGSSKQTAPPTAPPQPEQSQPESQTHSRALERNQNQQELEEFEKGVSC